MLKEKIEAIANKYAALVEKRLTSALQKDEVESTTMYEINDGIRILHHAIAMLERLSRISHGND